MSTMSSTPKSSSPRRIRSGVVLLTFIAVLVDGFDTAILALLVPHLAQDWGTSAAAFTYPLVLTNLGVVVGYLTCGWLSARVGQRPLLVWGVAVFGLSTIATAITLHWNSMAALSITRALTGIGLGVVLPLAIVIATGNSPTKHRQVVTVGVTMGLTTGAAIAGFTGNVLIDMVGTAGVFWISGIVPLLLVPALAKVKIEPLTLATAGEKKDVSVSRLFGIDIRTSTLVLWVATFLIFTVSYTLKSWIPTLLGFYGLDRATAGTGLGFLSLGGVVGGLILIPLSARLGGARALLLMSLVAAAAVAVIAQVQLSTPVLLAVIGIAGAGVVAGQIGQAAIAVSLYSQAARATGVGWAAAMGRTGSIIGPAIVGVLLALAMPAQTIVLLLVLPILITTMCWFVLSTRLPKPSEPLPAPAVSNPR